MSKVQHFANATRRPSGDCSEATLPPLQASSNASSRVSACAVFVWAQCIAIARI